MKTSVLLVMCLQTTAYGWAFTDLNFDPNWRSLDNGNYLSWENRDSNLEPSNEVTSEVESNQAKLAPDTKLHLIFPGTKWCGAGNIASDYDDLGIKKETDKCCRAHDNCPDLLNAGESKYNLTNNSYITRLNCICDDDFYRCLHKVNDITANEIGVIYFNTIKQKCFKNEFPIVKCTKRGGLFKEKCVKYKLDSTRDKIYQWFDVPLF